MAAFLGNLLFMLLVIGLRNWLCFSCFIDVSLTTLSAALKIFVDRKAGYKILKIGLYLLSLKSANSVLWNYRTW